jgi:hypothetical protein
MTSLVLLSGMLQLAGNFHELDRRDRILQEYNPDKVKNTLRFQAPKFDSKRSSQV